MRLLLVAAVWLPLCRICVDPTKNPAIADRAMQNLQGTQALGTRLATLSVSTAVAIQLRQIDAKPTRGASKRKNGPPFHPRSGRFAASGLGKPFACSENRFGDSRNMPSPSTWGRTFARFCAKSAARRSRVCIPPGPPKFARRIIFIGGDFHSPPFTLESLL